jgi:hypothetical protein
MVSPRQEQSWITGIDLPMTTVALALMFALAIVTVHAAQAQNFTVIHDFTGGQDGGSPGPLTADGAGNLYGVAAGGTGGCGVVYKLAHKSSGWLFSTLYSFQPLGSGDGCGPVRVTIGPDGALYGTTGWGGATTPDCGYEGCGTVFQLKPR